MTDLMRVLPEGIPHPTTIVPTAAPTQAGGLLPVLAMAVAPGVDRAELDAFLTRYRFVRWNETARAGDSQARWTYEPDGRVVVTLLDEDGAARITLPPHDGIQRWAALTRVTGGTLSLMVLPDMPSADLRAIGARISPRPGRGGEYWHLSVGHLPARERSTQA
ncbi:hypothetical protein [Streptomyces albogriseolus]|uniref:hypothetical protein n=1 Tax=Streptomyces albogriseolus TaxID=1887 RepID=UPI0034614899